LNSQPEITIAEERLCSSCVGEEFLRGEIERAGEISTCSYCGKEGKTYSIEQMADEIELAFESHFEQTPTDPDPSDYAAISEGDAYWSRRGEPVTQMISSAAEVEEDVAEDIRSVLEERHSDTERDQMGEEGPFDEEAHYEEKNINDIEFRIEWEAFERGIKTEARFFSRSAEVTLKSVFEGLTSHQTRDGNSVVIAAGPGCPISSLHRARVFQSGTKLKVGLEHPDREIGPPPAIAATAGRMNARGISVFYGATTIKTAIAEVRPPVGSRVVVGRFEIIRPVRLLDVAALRSVFVKGSVFDSGFIRRLEHASFLEKLSERISKPVVPDDEPFEYLVTQAIADYLATEIQLDGITYSSVQTGEAKANVVLFHHASGVEALTLPKDAVVTAHLSSRDEEDSFSDYWVWEDVPAELRSRVTPAQRHT
jgi:hypothetical protein